MEGDVGREPARLGVPPCLEDPPLSSPHRLHVPGLASILLLRVGSGGGSGSEGRTHRQPHPAHTARAVVYEGRGGPRGGKLPSTVCVRQACSNAGGSGGGSLLQAERLAQVISRIIQL